MDYLKCSLTEIIAKLKAGEVTSVELVEACFDRIKATSDLNALNSTYYEESLARAREIDTCRAQGEDVGALGGVPLVIKDNINLVGTKTTCASKFLENFVSPYSATCAEKLIHAGAIIISKANMDEFAMGSSNENSAFGAVKNPVDPTRVPGGSSGGSACTVSACQCFGSLGTDTGGSIREPSSFCGVVGLKPTYGRVSRYGVVAFASSLDQVGPITRTVEDNALLAQIIAGKDKMDMTSADEVVPDFVASTKLGVSGLKIGVAKQFFTSALNPEVKSAIESKIAALVNLGAKVVKVDLPSLDTSLATYYVISSAEAASNLARFDGVKYGVRAEQYSDVVDLYFKSRTEGFGREVKRRIMLGNYVLSSGYFDAFYRKAKRVQKVIRQEFNHVFSECDVLICPTTATTAFKLGEKSNDPVAMYLTDIFTVPVNIAGVPALSMPCGKSSEGLPMGLQIIAKHFDESTIYRVAKAIESTTVEGE